MDVEEIQTHPCKFSKVFSRNVAQPNKLVQSGDVAAVEQQCRDEGDEIRKVGIVVPSSHETVARLCGWHHSSRIYRVSRASGGKDRHSKVLTSKGLRDRRVRLSVSTAIAFYDLQDRLGYDQPSKAVEWLIKAAEEAIAELPSLNCAFPETPPKVLTDGRRTEHGVEMELDDDYLNYQCRHQQQQQLSLSKSGCSSNSETSKGSGLSLARPDIRVSRVKARERARERAVKEKDKEREMNQNNGENPNAQNSSFTELLTAGISGISNNNNTSTGSGSAQQSPGGEGRQWPPSAPMDYFTSGLFESGRTHHSNSGFLNQTQLGNYSLPQSMIIPPFTHQSSEQQHFSFIPDHLQSQRGGVENYNLNFTMSSSSGLAGLNRGTLQSNSLVVPSLFPHLQRLSPPDGSSNAPFFIGAAAAAPLESNHHHHYHQFASGFDGPLQLYHGDGTRFSSNDGKGKH